MVLPINCAAKTDPMVVREKPCKERIFLWFALTPEQVPGTSAYHAVNDFRVRMVDEIAQELKDFGIDREIIHEMSTAKYTETLNKAVAAGAHLFLNFTFRPAKDRYLKVEPEVQNIIIYESSYDQSLCVPYLVRNLEHWDCSPWVASSDWICNLEALKRGTTPITIAYGQYRDWSDIAKLSKRFGRIIYAIKRGLVQYLYPLEREPEYSMSVAEQMAIERDFKYASQRETEETGMVSLFGGGETGGDPPPAPPCPPTHHTNTKPAAKE